jgi:WD40 repeat protein
MGLPAEFRVAPTSAELHRVTVDPAALKWTGGPSRLTTSTALEGDVAVAPDGRRLAFTSQIERTRGWSFPIERWRVEVARAHESRHSSFIEHACRSVWLLLPALNERIRCMSWWDEVDEIPDQICPA